MTRDPNRIPEILDRLRKVWEKHPDLRLGQLIENIFPNIADSEANMFCNRSAYYIEDEVFIEIIEKAYESIDKAKQFFRGTKYEIPQD